MDTGSERDRVDEALKFRTACRDLIDYEGNLINSRISWLVGSQAFLLGTYALLLNQPQLHMLPPLPDSAGLPGQAIRYNPAQLQSQIELLRFWFQFTGVSLGLITTAAVLAGYRAIIGHVEAYYWNVHRHLGSTVRMLVPFPMAGRSRRLWGMGSTVIGPLFVLVWVGLLLPKSSISISAGGGALALVALWWYFAARFTHTNEHPNTGQFHFLRNRFAGLFGKNVILVCGTADGKLGRPIADRLARNGYKICFYDGRQEKPLRDFEKKVHTLSTKQIERVRAVLVLVPRDEDVIQNVERLLKWTSEPDSEGRKLSSRAVFVVHSTISVDCAVTLNETFRNFTNPLIEMPVTGGVGAASGEPVGHAGVLSKLACFVYGSSAAIGEIGDILCVYTDQSARIDFPNAGDPAKAKLCNQVCLANNLIGAAESIALARLLGLDADMVLQGIARGAARSFSLEKHAPLMISRDYEKGFLASNLSKDLGYAFTSVENSDWLAGAQNAKRLLDTVQPRQTTPSVVEVLVPAEAQSSIAPAAPEDAS